jgi:type II secretory pathway component PulJ
MCTCPNPHIHGPPHGPGHRSRLGAEAGFTLIELLIATGLAITLLGGTFAILESSQRIQARDTELALTLQEGRVGIARMLREIRQASKVEEANANSIFFLATLGGKKWKVKYDCGVAQAGTSFHECVRYATEGTTLPGTGASILREVLNETAADLSDPVFVYSPSKAAPTLATVKIVLPAGGTLKQANTSGYTHHVILEDAADIRSLNP